MACTAASHHRQALAQQNDIIQQATGEGSSSTTRLTGSPSETLQHIPFNQLLPGIAEGTTATNGVRAMRKWTAPDCIPEHCPIVKYRRNGRRPSSVPARRSNTRINAEKYEICLTGVQKKVIITWRCDWPPRREETSKAGRPVLHSSITTVQKHEMETMLGMQNKQAEQPADDLLHQEEYILFPKQQHKRSHE